MSILRTSTSFQCVLGLMAFIVCQEIAMADRVESEPQVLPVAATITIPSDPFLINVSLTENGSLIVSPDWASLANPSDFHAMAQPASIRTVSENGWKTGEFELTDGTWSPLFVVPDADASVSDRPLEPLIPAPDATGPSAPDKGTPINNVSSAEIISDPLAIGAADPKFPSSVSAAYLQSVIARPLVPGARRFFVNNVSGNDLSEGKMLHPQTGKHSAKGPLKTLAAVLRQIRSGDEIVLIGTGTAYPANFNVPNVAEITITPVGDVTLNP